MSNSLSLFKISIEDLYGDLGMSEAELDAILDKSLKPRGPAMLYDKMSQLGPRPKDVILDIGSRDAQHSLELVKRFGSDVIAIDPVAFNIKKAQKLLSKNKEAAKKIHLMQAGIEALPLEDTSVNFIWSRDMLNHVPNLQLGFRECARVLKLNGKMLIFVNLATDLLEPRESQFLCESLSLVPANMCKENFEIAIRHAKLRISECDRVDSEWRKWGFEQNGEIAHTARQLLRLARMRRNRAKLIRKVGRVNYLSELANCYWGVYIMLGKLCPYVYTLQKKKS